MFSSNNRSSSKNLISDTGLYNFTSNDDIVPYGIKQMVVHQSVTSIKPDAFEGITSLESISIPNSVKFIEEYAFNCCSSLVSIAMSDTHLSHPTCSHLITTLLYTTPPLKKDVEN